MRGVCGVRAKSPCLLPALRRQLKEMGLFKSQGLIGDKWTDAEDGRTLPVNNPATGESLTPVPFLNVQDTKKAITAASHAFTFMLFYHVLIVDYFIVPVRPLATLRRCQDIQGFNLLIENEDDLAKLMVLEQGKPLAEAAGEIVYDASFVGFYAEEGKRIYGDMIPSPFAEKRILVMKLPIGVVVAVTPWNSPLAMITRKVAPALAAGCAVIVKPSELTPLTALAAAEVAVQAGIPPGMMDVVMGNAVEIGNALFDSTEVEKHVQDAVSKMNNILNSD